MKEFLGIRYNASVTSKGKIQVEFETKPVGLDEYVWGLFRKELIRQTEDEIKPDDEPQVSADAGASIKPISEFKKFVWEGGKFRMPDTKVGESFSIPLRDENEMSSEYCSIRAAGRKLKPMRKFKTYKTKTDMVYTRVI